MQNIWTKVYFYCFTIIFWAILHFEILQSHLLVIFGIKTNNLGKEIPVLLTSYITLLPEEISTYFWIFKYFNQTKWNTRNLLSHTISRMLIHISYFIDKIKKKIIAKIWQYFTSYFVFNTERDRKVASLILFIY